MPAFLIFVQAEGAPVPLETLAGRARAQFGATTSVLDVGTPEALHDTANRTGIRLRVEVVASGESGVFRLGARAVTTEDVTLARAAEQRGQRAGMGELAARCHSVWSIETESGPEWMLLELCALLAFAGLGPVLPPDGATLLGVRSAQERAARLRRSS